MCAESANLTGDKRDRSIKITKSAKTVAKDNIIEVKHYKMVFADKTVIKDLSFEVKKGEVFVCLAAMVPARLPLSVHYLVFIRPPTANS